MSKSMLSFYVIIKNAFYFQAGIGVSANTFFLLFHILILHQNHRLKPTDLVTCHLALVHMVIPFTAMDILSPDLFESLNFQNDLKCKALFYMSRVMRGLSICTTCFLSVIQAITISPSNSWLANFKHKLTNCIMCIYFFFFWFLNLSSNSNLIFYTVAYSNMTQTGLLNINRYCSFSSPNSIIRYLFFTLTTSSNVFLIGTMLLSSVYMVILLCRHQRRSDHLHSTCLSPKPCPEKRATQTVLLLVSFFVSMYLLDIITSSFSTILRAYDPGVLAVQRLVTNIYASVSPLLQIGSSKRIINIFQNMHSK